MGRMNRDVAKLIVEQIEAALPLICERNQVTYKQPSARFDAATLRVTLEFHAVGADGEDAAERMTWDLCAGVYGVQKEDFGKIITYSDMRRYKLVAIQPKSSRYPFLGEDLGRGKRYKLTAEGVRWGLEQLAKKQEVQS